MYKTKAQPSKVTGAKSNYPHQVKISDVPPSPPMIKKYGPMTRTAGVSMPRDATGDPVFRRPGRLGRTGLAAVGLGH